MDRVLRQKLWHVRWRCSVNRWLWAVSCVTLAVGAAACGVVIAEKLLAVGMVSRVTMGGAAAAVIVASMAMWVRARPTKMQLAVWLDERAHLRERASSSLALAGATDGFAAAALAEAESTLRTTSPVDYFPLELPPRAPWAVGLWAGALGLWLILPQGDLLSRLARREQVETQQRQVREIQSQAETAKRQVETASRMMGMSLVPETADVGTPEPRPTATPAEARRSAARDVSELRRRVAQAREDPRFDGIAQLQRKLQGLRTPDTGPSRTLARQLARGQFGQAAESLRALRDQLKSKELTDEQREQLARQLAQLGEQLSELANRQWKLDNEMKRAGLDPKLAQDLDALRQAIEKSSLSQAQKRRLLEMARQQSAACRMGGSLGRAMSAAAAGMAGAQDGQLAGAMSATAEQLDALEALGQQLALTEATLADLDRSLEDLWEGTLSDGTCSACLGKGCARCGGSGKGPWRAGESLRASNGMGGPGRGRGQVADSEATDTSMEKTRVKGQSRPAPIVASWYIEGPQVRGESRREFADVAASAQRQASDAIQDQRIPMEYHEPVKRYFGTLHAVTPNAESP